MRQYAVIDVWSYEPPKDEQGAAPVMAATGESGEAASGATKGQLRDEV
jgi:hypothetical protein